MPQMIWTTGFSVGVPLMDAQHKRLIALINATDRLTDVHAMADAIHQMFEYAHMHFRVEEELLRAKGYPELEQQLHEHALFFEQATAFLSKKLTDPKVKAELNGFLCKWLSHHILEVDMKYKHFLLPVKG